MERSDLDRNGPDNSRKDFSDAAPQILIVERNQSTRELMRRVLRSQYRVDTAPTYENGLNRAETESYDAIVLSVYHRELEEGIDMTRDLRSVEGLSSIPIIAVCPPIVEHGSGSLLEAGCDDVLNMPFTKSDLMEMLGRHLPGTNDEADA